MRKSEDIRLDGIKIEPFQDRDFGAVVTLFQRCLPKEPITPETFALRVLLDLNFDPQDAPTARDGEGRVVGFLLAVTPRHATETASPGEDCGWITLFAVAAEARSRGIGGRLLDWAESRMRSKGLRAVLISSYAQGYWTPGVDESAFPATIAWLHRRNYRTISRPLSMQLDFGPDWRVPAEISSGRGHADDRVTVEPFTPEQALPLTRFLGAEFPGDWQRVARDTMRDILRGVRPAEALWVAHRDNGRLAGFVQCEGERFGPIGVAHSERGQGIGQRLMVAALEAMRANGAERAWFLWTNDATAERFYQPVGFRPRRRFAVLKKTL